MLRQVLHHFLVICTLALLLPITTSAADSPIASMKLLPGYTHLPLQGIDSLVGKIVKKDGLEIFYEKGAIALPGQPRIGGGFSNRAKLTPNNLKEWSRVQTVNGHPAHVTMLKSGQLLVSWPTYGMNFSAKIDSHADLADALLMIMTYPVKQAQIPAKQQPKP